jgi:hypothetical protein
MVDKCNKNLGVRISSRLETSTAITYENNMDCYNTVSVEGGYQILIVYKIFEASVQNSPVG